MLMPVPFSPSLLRQLLPAAVAWVEEQERDVTRRGRPLVSHFLALAGEAGVLHPERVRTLAVPTMPRPGGELGRANDVLGFVGAATAGLTVGYGILLRADAAQGEALLYHELIHVGQYERLGGVAGFLPSYLGQCAEFGYEHAPLEVEAVEGTRRRFGGAKG